MSADSPFAPTAVDRQTSGYPFLAPAQAPDEMGRLGSYSVRRVLGEGGMGTVFEAEDGQLQRRIAIKVMKPTLAASEIDRHRFVREARAMAAVQHDNIIAIHQVGEANGIPYLVMPLLRGESLHTRLVTLKKQSRLIEPMEVIRIGCELAAGLAAAHDRGLMHRDIKPSNIWLEGDEGRVKILDFGLVRTCGDDSGVTLSGAVVGTPGYMAPEQARGTPDPFMRSDLFSLGCVLYQLSTNVRPFTSNNPYLLLEELESHQPAPPANLSPAIPERLSLLILRLIAKRPDDRPQSAREVQVELGQCCCKEEPTPAPDSTIIPVNPADKGLGRSNPFVWRAGITEPDAFFGRQRELRIIREFLQKRQNCQVMGPRRIGKTSLLLALKRAAPAWEPRFRIAYLDLQLPQCFSISGWMRRVSKQLAWPTEPRDLPEFADAVENMLDRGTFAVLCLDEFAELAQRPTEFTRDFFTTLRACGQQGLSIVTAADRPLSELTDPTDRVVSPFYNTFPLLRLGSFPPAEAQAYVSLPRPELEPFADDEQRAIVTFAHGHPLALQVACAAVLARHQDQVDLETAIRQAEQDMRALLPTW